MEDTLFDKKRSGRPLKSNHAQPISDKLKEDPYMSTHQLAEAVGMNKQTVKRVLIDELNMVKINLKWIPHVLTDEIKKKRVAIAKTMLDFLSHASENALNSIYTEDETWIYFENSHKSMWLLQGSEIPTIPNHAIGSKKAMIAVVWSRTDLKSITMLGPNEKFNKQFFIRKVLGDLKKKYKTKGKILHMDNARPHLVNDKLAKIGIRRLEHPPYSPDLAPSDYFLYGYLSFMLEGCFFKTAKELFDKVTEILTSIPNFMFKNAYEEWPRRL